MSKTNAPAFTRRRKPPVTTHAERVLKVLASTIGEIEAAQRRFDSAGMKSRHEIGKLLIRDFDKIETAKQYCITYRMEFWETLAERVGLHSRILRDCMAFAGKYDEAKVDELIEHGLTWTHVVHLLSLRTEEEREAFLERVTKEGLTATALHKEIMEELGNRRAGSGKQRKMPEPPKTLKSGLKRAADKVTRLNDEHEHALFCDDYDLAEEIENEPPDEITKETGDNVDQLIKSYEQLAKSAAKIVNSLREARPRIDRVMEERERAAAKPDAKTGTESRTRPIMLTAPVGADTDRTVFPAGHAAGK